MPRRLLLILPILALLALATAPAAQAAGLLTSNVAWTWQNPLPHGDQLNAVAYRTGTEAWAVGLSRGFYKTGDDGATWSVTRTGNSLGFYDVAFADAQHGAAVGESSSTWDFTGYALAWRTSDGGTTWKAARVTGTDEPLASVSFGSATAGWAVGRSGTIITTADAGDTWTVQAEPTEVSSVDLTGVSFVDATHGWAIGTDPDSGESYVIRTTDGANWALVDVIGGSYLFNCDFVDQQNGWAVGWSGTVWHTSDGGATWAAQALPGTDVYTKIDGLEFVNGTTGWLVSNQGKIYVTTNAGATWTIQKTVAGTQLMGVGFRDATHGIAVGDDGVTLTTADGLTWTEVGSGLRTLLTDCSFVSANKGWAVGFNGQVGRTTDGGATWKFKKAPTSKNLVAVDFVNSSRGWLVGRRGTIMTTRNGNSWKYQNAKTKLDINGVEFVSTSKGWVVGVDGLILATKDGGKTWRRQKSGTATDLSDVTFVDSLHGWACGLENGVVLRTTNGGKTWQRSRAHISPWKGGTLYDVCFTSRKIGWVSGITNIGAQPQGVVFATTDGGQTWNLKIPAREKMFPNHAITGIDFVNKKQGWLVGEHGLFAYTLDGGETWVEPARIAPDETLLKVTFVNASTGYAVGTGGTIVKTTSGGK